jgi:hypothetical protein
MHGLQVCHRDAYKTRTEAGIKAGNAFRGTNNIDYCFIGSLWVPLDTVSWYLGSADFMVLLSRDGSPSRNKYERAL